jgi:hypothetical protein
MDIYGKNGEDTCFGVFHRGFNPALSLDSVYIKMADENEQKINEK